MWGLWRSVLFERSQIAVVELARNRFVAPDGMSGGAAASSIHRRANMTDDRIVERLHAGVVMTGNDGPKAFYILIEVLPGREEEVVQMLRDIRACVEDEPATGPWFAVRHSPTTFAIFEAFPDIAGRDAHVARRGGDIFRDAERMNAILKVPAHVQKVDILFDRGVFA
jgi:hypothetical protein